MPSDRVHCLAVSQEGAIWVGTPAGAARYSSAIGAEDWQVFTERDGLPSNFITSILSAKDGSVWVGALRGAARYGATGWVHHKIWQGIDDRGGVALEQDRAGELWAATGEALYRLIGGRWKAVHRFDDTRRFRPGVDIKQGTDGSIWVAANGHLLRGQGGTWNVVDTCFKSSPCILRWKVVYGWAPGVALPITRAKAGEHTTLM